MALHDIAQGISKELQGKSFAGSLKFDCGSDGVIILADGINYAEGTYSELVKLKDPKVQAFFK